MTINYKELQKSADRACELLKVLANSDRLMLVCQLINGEQCVSDIERTTGIQQPTLSQQLGVLREANIVTTRREGKHIFYNLKSTEALAIIQILQEQFCQEAMHCAPNLTNQPH